MASSTEEMPRPGWTILAADEGAIEAAASRLAAGGAVVLPTETVYGLAADASQPRAVARLFALKGRPAANPLIVHVAGLGEAAALADVDSRARRLAEAFWPGPLTLVLPLRAAAPLAPAITAGLKTVALRHSAHPVFARVLERLGRPLAAPSANVSGRLSPTRASHAALPGEGLVLDGGPCAIGLESSIVGAFDGALRLLRPGALDAQTLAEAAGAPVVGPQAGGPARAPGAAFRHYAPRLPLDLDVIEPPPKSFHLGFGAVDGDLSLSPSGDLAEAAAALFDALHRADASGARRIAVAPIPAHGLGAAIRDRLERAASAQAEAGTATSAATSSSGSAG